MRFASATVTAGGLAFCASFGSSAKPAPVQRMKSIGASPKAEAGRAQKCHQSKTMLLCLPRFFAGPLRAGRGRKKRSYHSHHRRDNGLWIEVRIENAPHEKPIPKGAHGLHCDFDRNSWLDPASIPFPLDEFDEACAHGPVHAAHRVADGRFRPASAPIST